MPRRSMLIACAGAATLLSACGGHIEVPQQDAALHHGAELFNQRSKPAGQAKPGERTDGPNFNVRKENVPDVLFAIRNGGFSGAIMPANVVVGRDAQDVAMFLARYAGKKRSDSQPSSGHEGASNSGGP
jgi:hypothetical protein